MFPIVLLFRGEARIVCDRGLNRGQHVACAVTREDGIGLSIEHGRCEILGAVEREFAVSPKFPRDRREALEMRRERRRQTVALGQQDIGHVVNARRFHAVGPEQALQRQLDDLLRFAHHVGPAAAVEQHVEGLEPRAGTFEVSAAKS